MKNNKIQCILCLVISVLCWSNVFGESEKMLTDSVCWNYQLEVSAEPTTLYMDIYNVTDFGPYTPDVVEWYSPDWQLDFGDSATVVYELDVNFPPSFEMLICADYEVDGETCTVCEWVFIGDVNSCEYELDIETEGMVVFGSVINTVHYCPPTDVTWILEGGGGVIGNEPSLFYQFDEVGEYIICAEYSDNILGCEGVICETIVIDDESTADCVSSFGIDYFVQDNWGVFEASYPEIYEVNEELIAWTINGEVIEYGGAMDYIFPSDSTYVVCMTALNVVNIATGEACPAIQVCTKVEVVNNQTDCEADFEIESFTEYNWSTFYLYNPDYFLSVDSIAWYIDGQFVEYAIQMDYEFPNDGVYTVCAIASVIMNVATGEICPQAEVCTNVEIITQEIGCDSLEIYPFINGNWGYFDFGYSGAYDLNGDSIGWYVNEQFVEYGYALDYSFPDDGVYSVCVAVPAFLNLATGETCPPAEVCVDVEIISQEITCDSLGIYPIMNGNWGYFDFAYFNAYDLNEDSIGWYVNGQFVEYGYAMGYNFPDDGLYSVCVAVPPFLNLATGETCSPAEVCIDVEIISQQDDCEAFFEWQDNGNINGVNSVTFANASTGNYTDALWSFGNGNTGNYSGQDSFEYIYENIGVYNVCLTVFDNVGCQSTHCEIVLVSGTPNVECDYEVEYEALNDSLFMFALMSSTGISGNPLWLDSETGEEYGVGDSIVLVFDDFGEYEVCAHYETGGNLCWGEICVTVTVENSACEDTDCVFPGDADRNMIADNYDVLPIGLHFGETGPARPDATIGWYGQPAPDWQAAADSVNLKHVDCNGDGEIYFDDVDAIEQNYNHTHDGVYAMRVEGAPGLHLEFDLDTIYSAPDTGTIVINADIIMGTANLPVEGVYGVAFSIGYSADLVDTNAVAADYFMGSWIGDPTTVLQLEKNVINESVIDFGYSRTDQQNISGFGQIGSVSFVMTDNIIGKLASEVELNFPITNVRAIDNTGEEIVITGSDNNVVVNLGNTTTAVQNPDLSQNINIFPNPTSNTINMTISDLQAQTVTLYNVVGQRVLARQIAAEDTQIDVRHLPSGVYLVSVQTEKGIYNQKIIVE